MTPLSISLAAAAELLGCSESHLRRLAQRGQLPGAYRMGHRWLVVRHVLVDHVEQLATVGSIVEGIAS